MNENQSYIKSILGFMATASAVGFFIIATQTLALAVQPMVAAGGWHTVGLKSDGTVVAVGDNTSGQLNVDNWTDIIQVDAGYAYTVGLKSNGKVVVTGYIDGVHSNVDDWTDIIQVAAGYHHIVGLKSDGTVVAVGFNDYGQCDVGSWTDIVQVAAGSMHTVGLKSDGKAVAVGDNLYGKLNVDNWTDIIQVAAGWIHTVGLKSYGKAVAVGDNTHLQCEVQFWENNIQLAAGGWHTVGLLPDGTVWAVGSNTSGQLNVDNWTDIIQVDADWLHTVGLKSNGTVEAVGDCSYDMCNTTNWHLIGPDVVEIINPVPGTTLTSSTVTFSWTGNGFEVGNWMLYVGTAVGAWDIYDSGWLGTSTSTTVSGLPTDGSQVYVTLFYAPLYYGYFEWKEYQYTAITYLIVEGTCPIDISVTDPDGLVVNKQENEIDGATYIEADINDDGDPDDQVIIPVPKIGNYQITVIPEADATPTDTYTLRVSIGGTSIMPAENVSISDIPDQPYVIVSTEEGIHVDNDVDGIPDDVDNCPGSNLELNIIIDGCESGVENLLFEDGCTMSDLIAGCADGAKNHGKFSSCVDHLTNNWKKEKLIEGKEQDSIQSCAEHANIP